MPKMVVTHAVVELDRWLDMEGLQELIASPSPEDKGAQERHGVTQPITVYIEK